MTDNIDIIEKETFKEFDILIDGTVIGSAEIKYPDMTLNNFFIYPQFRNKGYGTEAIKQLVEKFGVTNLWVSCENETARHIYEKNGFIVNSKPKYIAMKLKREDWGDM